MSVIAQLQWAEEELKKIYGMRARCKCGLDKFLFFQKGAAVAAHECPSCHTVGSLKV